MINKQKPTEDTQFYYDDSYTNVTASSSIISSVSEKRIFLLKVKKDVPLFRSHDPKNKSQYAVYKTL
jgi:hypothetical protein